MLEQWGINMIDIEKQFAGNYVRLVNQCRDLQADIAERDRTILRLTTCLVAEQNKKAADSASI